ncbi:STAS domain-containing protein [Planotetraspora phitsanulokensis]|uniref:Anti-sigma factor antagonist n=1 Tax=Planotetraspora phitsanulokensis TaxID=575192 RepID=A0A8J3UIR4_9ACTN|nr:STAS domain-containing protein [Planotetraspora phitsanulokensis]GII43049.1 anti-sigma factor antagonist [Planotetraspora phitsanulokensis]
MLELTVNHEATHAVVAADGEIDFLSADLLSAVLNKQLAEGRPHLIIDASRLSFCDSTGLGVLLEARATAIKRGGFVRLAGVHGSFDRLLSITGLRGAAFPVFDSVAEAASA